jgi:hypothetical protein
MSYVYIITGYYNDDVVGVFASLKKAQASIPAEVWEEETFAGVTWWDGEVYAIRRYEVDQLTDEAVAHLSRPSYHEKYGLISERTETIAVSDDETITVTIPERMDRYWVSDENTTD